MTVDELLTLCQLKGLRARTARDEVQIQDCPICGNPKWNMEVNPSRGLFHAWCCGAHGRAERFIKDYLGVEVSIPVNAVWNPQPTRVLQAGPDVFNELTSEWARYYVTTRSLDSVDTRIYEIGEGKGPTWGGRVVFTLRDYWTRDPVGFIGRAALPGVHPKYFAHWDSGKKSIFGYRNKSNIHVMVEGVLDGIRIHQAGLNAAVLGGVTGPAIEEWSARVPGNHHIVVLLDGDAVEQTRKLYWRLLPIHERICHIELPDGLDPATLDTRVVHALIRSKVHPC